MNLYKKKREVSKMDRETLVRRLGICKQIAKLITLYDKLDIKAIKTRYENEVELFYIQERLDK